MANVKKEKSGKEKVIALNEDEMPRKLALFLGTFDPIHNGHMHIAENVLQELDLDYVIIVPSYDSPHKEKKAVSCPKKRMEMCALACEDLRFISASDIEITNKLEGYSLKKIDLITSHYPGAEIYYIIGSDAYMTILNWPSLGELIKKVVFCVLIRDKSHNNEVIEIKNKLDLMASKTHICKFTTLDISSTDIKSRINKGEDTSSLLTRNVEKYIRDNKLYR